MHLSIKIYISLNQRDLHNYTNTSYFTWQRTILPSIAEYVVRYSTAEFTTPVSLIKWSNIKLCPFHYDAMKTYLFVNLLLLPSSILSLSISIQINEFVCLHHTLSYSNEGSVLIQYRIGLGWAAFEKNKYIRITSAIICLQ